MTVFIAEQLKTMWARLPIFMFICFQACKTKITLTNPFFFSKNGVSPAPPPKICYFLNEKFSTISWKTISRKTAKAKLFMFASGTKPYLHSFQAIMILFKTKSVALFWFLPHSFGNRSHKIKTTEIILPESHLLMSNNKINLQENTKTKTYYFRRIVINS